MAAQYEVLMPKLGIMLEGEIVEWLKKEGDFVNAGDVILKIETGKVIYSVESKVTGFLVKILFPVGSVVPVGKAVAYIEKHDEELLAKNINEGVLISENRPNEACVGQKTGGRQIKERIPLSGIRLVTSKRMLESSQKIPQAVIFMDVVMNEVQHLHQEMLDNIMKKSGIKLTFTDIFIWIVAKALEKHININSCMSGREIEIFKEINIGFAMATSNGLLVPVVHKANQKSLTEIAKMRSDLVKKIINMKYSESDITGSTFTISNLGMKGVDKFIPLVNPGESAILGISAIKQKPVVYNEKIVIKNVLELSLAFDHRVIDGAPAADFLGTVKSFLEKPPLDLLKM